jgi:hypothetical protein
MLGSVCGVSLHRVFRYAGTDVRLPKLTNHISGLDLSTKLLTSLPTWWDTLRSGTPSAPSTITKLTMAEKRR